MPFPPPGRVNKKPIKAQKATEKCNNGQTKMFAPKFLLKTINKIASQSEENPVGKQFRQTEQNNDDKKNKKNKCIASTHQHHSGRISGKSGK